MAHFCLLVLQFGVILPHLAHIAHWRRPIPHRTIGLRRYDDSLTLIASFDSSSHTGIINSHSGIKEIADALPLMSIEES
ncbi:MAG: hypothetical protein JRJ47_00970 [Deltaproteobacteria bacterium]|nr:hypothetical protein [Deltaproteobacteria bacterium]